MSLQNEFLRLAFRRNAFGSDVPAAKDYTRIEGDQEVMRRARYDPKARGIVCAVKRANVIGARDQRTTSGPTGVMTRINRPKT